MAAQRNNIWTPAYFPRLAATEEVPFLRWWYRFTTPWLPMPTTSFREQEAWRRARMLSNIVLAEMILALCVIIFALFNQHYASAYGQCAFLGMFCLGLWLNRQGNHQGGSVLVVLISEISIILTLTLEYTFFKNSTIPLWGLYYLIIPEVIAGILLPIRYIALLVGIHCLFTTAMLLLPQPGSTPAAAGIMFAICGIFLLVAFIMVLWRRRVAFLLAHADSVEVVAALEHAMAEQEHIAAQHKRELDQSINRLMQTHLRIANGEYDVRVPISEEDTLWPIAGSLNTLLARIQRLGQSARKLEKTEQEAARLAAALRALRTGGTPVSLQRSGTAIDLILIELTTTVEIERVPSETIVKDE